MSPPVNFFRALTLPYYFQGTHPPHIIPMKGQRKGQDGTRFIERIERPRTHIHTGSRKFGLEAPSGVEPLHRSFAVRPTSLRPLTLRSDRLRRPKKEIKRFGNSVLLAAADLDSEPGPKPGEEPGVKLGSGFIGRCREMRSRF